MDGLLALGSGLGCGFRVALDSPNGRFAAILERFL
jgi:hypothetical protein